MFSSISLWLKKNYISLLLITFLVLVAYSNSFNGQFVSDDIEAIPLNEFRLKAVGYMFDIPRFFARTSILFLAYKIVGLAPFLYHFINIFFHIGSVWMVFILGNYFFKKKYVPLIAASIFAVHPLLTESVSWISGGIYAQSGFFILLTFILYLYGRKMEKKYYYLSLGCYVLALSSSEKAIIFPIILVLYEFLFNGIKQSYKRIIPYIIISFSWALFMISAIGSRLAFINTQTSSQEPVVYNPFLHIPVVVVRYLILLFWPSQLSLYHYDFYVPAMEYILILAAFILFIIAMYYSFKKNKPIFFWLCFFIITLLPTLNPFGLASINAERYVYLGSVGIIFIVSYFLSDLLIHKKYHTAGMITISLIIVSLLVRTILRNNDWQSSENLWKATIRVVPKDPKPYNNLANIYSEQGNYQEAIYLLTTAISLNPTYADPYHNLAHVYQKSKNYKKALEFYQKALIINPKLWQSFQNIGIIYYDLGNYAEAERYMTEALKLTSSNANLYANYGHVLLEQGKKQQAEAAFMNSLQIDQNNPLARKGLEILLIH